MPDNTPKDRDAQRRTKPRAGQSRTTRSAPPTSEPRYNPRISPLPRPVGVDPVPEPAQQTPTAPQYVEVPPAADGYNLCMDKRRLLNNSIRVIAYVAIVLGVDALASVNAQVPIHWGAFQWRPGTFFSLAESAVNALNLPYAFCTWMQNPLVQGIDIFKLIFWLIIPLIFTWRSMDWGYWRTTRWKSNDLWILTAIAAIGIGAMMAMRYLPALQGYYPSHSGSSFALKADFVVTQLFWIVSWLVGYEFLHRYVLLQRLDLHWPQFGWLLVPLFDGAYHLTKAWPEMLAMMVFAVFLTWWTRKRRNLLLPLTAHLIIKIELVAFLVLF